MIDVPSWSNWGEVNPTRWTLTSTKRPLSREVCPVCIPLAVFLAVVFVDPTSTNHPEISPRRKVAPFVVDLLLRLDLDVRDDMQQTQD